MKWILKIYSLLTKFMATNKLRGRWKPTLPRNTVGRYGEKEQSDLMT